MTPLSLGGGEPEKKAALVTKGSWIAQSEGEWVVEYVGTLLLDSPITLAIRKSSLIGTSTYSCSSYSEEIYGE